MRWGFINRPFKAFCAADLPMRNAARFYLLPAGRPTAATSRSGIIMQCYKINCLNLLSF
jgi:hypothetical protein